MGIIGTIFLVIFAIAAILIIALVMLQDEQGEGFGGLFGGGGGAATPFGATGGNVLTKATTVLGVLFMVSSLAVAMTISSGDEDNVIGESRAAAGTGRIRKSNGGRRPLRPADARSEAAALLGRHRAARPPG